MAHIEFVQHMAPEMCSAAVDQNPDILPSAQKLHHASSIGLKFVQGATPEMCLAAIEKNSEVSPSDDPYFETLSRFESKNNNSSDINDYALYEDIDATSPEAAYIPSLKAVCPGAPLKDKHIPHNKTLLQPRELFPQNP